MTWLGRGLRLVCYALFAAAVAVYLYGAVRSPLLDPGRAAEAEALDRAAGAAAPTVSAAAEEALARAYWARNPDVRADGFYGEGGRLGIAGARTHYRDHGRREGRRWGL